MYDIATVIDFHEIHHPMGLHGHLVEYMIAVRCRLRTLRSYVLSFGDRRQQRNVITFGTMKGVEYTIEEDRKSGWGFFSVSPRGYRNGAEHAAVSALDNV